MDPIFLKIGFLEIRYYGLMYAVALLVAIRLILKELRRRQVKFVEDDILNLIILTFLGGILFARLYYVFFNLSYYIKNPAEILAIWHGGLAIHGGLLGALIIGYFGTKYYKTKPWLFADVIAPYVLLGQVFGRFGNFMNGDAHGIPTSMPWGIIFPAGTPAGDQFPGIPTHPTMIYELILNLIFFLILHRLRLGKYKNGYIFCMYLIFYSIARLIVNPFRADSLMLGHYNVAMWASIFLIIVSNYFIQKYRLNKP